MKARTIVLWGALFLAAPLFARDKSDVIIMRNGDRITCEIKGLDADTLFISVDYILSTQSVDWSKVDHVESKQLFIVKTQDGSVYSGTLSTPETPGNRPIKIAILEPAANAKVEVDKMEIIKMDETSSNFWQRFNGEIGMGVIYNKGNQSTQYSLNSEVNYPRPRWAANATVNSTLSSSTGTNPATRNQITMNVQRLLRWNNWYYAGLADFLQSSVQGIQLQTTFGGGVGRYLKNTNHATISVTGGVAWQRINYLETVVPARHAGRDLRTDRRSGETFLVQQDHSHGRYLSPSRPFRTRPRALQPEHLVLRKIVEQSHLEHFALRQLGQSPATRVRRERLRHQLRRELDLRQSLRRSKAEK